MSTSFVQYPVRGVPIYTSVSALPSPVPTSGSLAEVADTNILYVSNGSAWVALASPGASPTAIDGLTGDVSATGPGVVAATVNSVGGQTAAHVAQATSQVLGAIPSLTHQIYVSQAGNDSTGTGSELNPYLTVAKALTAVGSTSTTIRYQINIGPGRFTETNLVLPSGVTLSGVASNSTAIVVNTPNSISLSSSFGAGSQLANTSIIQHMTLQGSGALTIDFTVSSSSLSGLIIGFRDCNANLVTTLKGRPGFADSVQCVLSSMGASGGISQTGALSSEFLNGSVGSLTVNGLNTTSGDFVGASIGNCTLAGNISFDISGGSGISGELDLATSSFTFGALTLSVNGGANPVNVFNDSVSLPLAANLTVGTNVTFNASNDAAGLLYSPSTSSNWSPTPTQVSSALDQLAARQTSVSPSVTSPGSYPYTTLTADKIVQVDSSSARTINLIASASAKVGQILYIKDHAGNATTNNISVVPNGSEKIDGMSSASITINYGVIRLYSDGSNWFSL